MDDDWRSTLGNDIFQIKITKFTKENSQNLRRGWNREAMHGQWLEGMKTPSLLNARWANDDPNPASVSRSYTLDSSLLLLLLLNGN